MEAKYKQSNFKRPWKTVGHGAATFIETADGDTLCQMVGPNRETKAMAILRDYDTVTDLLSALEAIISMSYAMVGGEKSDIYRIASKAISKVKGDTP